MSCIRGDFAIVDFLLKDVMLKINTQNKYEFIIFI